MKRILIEREKCYGCWTCMFACMNMHRKDQGAIDDLPVFSRIESRGYVLYAGGYSTPVYCRHCDEPECVAACMSGALRKSRASGHVFYDKDRCGQCFMCVMYCPYGLPKPDNLTRSEVIKCSFCAGAADSPSCVASCPTGAITVKEVEGPCGT